jgi:predicted glycogen debranching enzyme
MIRFNKDLLHVLNAAVTREWLETNGIGGFASSTVIGLNTRRYHALLTAALHPPAGRVVLLSKLEETIIIDDRRYDLAANQYVGAVHPQGYTYMEDFRLDPWPVFRFAVEDVVIEKSLFMVHGQNTTVVEYRVSGQSSRAVYLEISPLIAFRDYHGLTHENGALDAHVQEHHPGLASVRPYSDHPNLYFGHNANELRTSGYWYRNFEYALERERGLDCVEDLFNPFMLRFNFDKRNTATIIASVLATDAGAAEMLRMNELKRRRQICLPEAAEDDLVTTLVSAADQYIVNRGDQKTIIAGYPWFTDWGRDTMIALPGITLVTNRSDVARSILCEFARYVDHGMLPNRFPDAGEAPEYNTIDATLWYFEAVRSLLQHTNDYAFVQTHLYSVLTDIIDWHLRGTRYGIRMDADGLIASTDPTVQLTWMDAKIGDWVVTPRNGKAVEIQALWYNALRTIEDIAEKIGNANDALKYRVLADRTKHSFNILFWNDSLACVYDCVLGEQSDSTMRPNQILAVSLTHSMLSDERAKSVVDSVQRELFTPYGLRSLSPRDPRYRGRYEGDSFARDSSYHQGPVWAWLLGPFIDAYLKVNTTDGQAQVREWLQVISTHLSEAGLGHVSEIFDGDPPHHPRGCFAQAWSVAEILRAVVENGLVRQPTQSKSAPVESTI